MNRHLSIWVAVMCLAVIGWVLIWVDNPILDLPDQQAKLMWTAAVLAVCLVVVFLDALGVLGVRKLVALEFAARVGRALRPSRARAAELNKQDLQKALRARYGLLWQRRVRLVLVVGNAACIEAIAPGLAKKRWMEGYRTVLLHGGSVADLATSSPLPDWHGLLCQRGVDAVVWALDGKHRADLNSMQRGFHGLHRLATSVGWHLPLHLWQICASKWPQQTGMTQAVGTLLPATFKAGRIESTLAVFQQRLRDQGLGRVRAALSDDFLLRLSRDLRTEGLAFYQATLAAAGREPGVAWQGMWFSLPAPAGPGAVEPDDRDWLPPPEWQGIAAQRAARQRMGWGAWRIGYIAALGLAGLCIAGVLVSFVNNRSESMRIAQALVAAQTPAPGQGSMPALTTLTHELSRLDYRLEHGAPWHHRFGLDHTRALYHSAWPAYARISAQLLREPAAARLHQQLSALIALPPGSPERARRAQQGYAQLKAYLMLTHPAKTDADFLVSTLGDRDPAAWAFQARHLVANPGWAIEPDRRLIAQTRQVLLGQLGQRNGETTLYRQALAAAANHYPALGLQQMVGETDASALFSNPSSVPGVFTREAWEGHVRKAIDEAARARREEIDWVLSDSPGDIAAELSPDALRERLTQRYFDDYGRAWLDFLNRTRWRSEDGLEAVIGQLSLISDARQSPLIALLNTLAYQGQAGMRGQALAESLLKSAQNLVGREVPERVVEALPDIPAGPLDPTFGPMLALLGKAPQARPEELSLQRYLTQVTGVRLKLQQVANAADPQAMTQALAQTVFQGRQVELTDTRAYANLVAASLGAEWAPAAQALFVQPLEQAWQRVLQPSAASLNRHWQRAVVDDWNAAFNGRYPFAATGSDSSLPMLGQMIRADSGRIEAFMREQLAGLVHKEGSRWLATPGQGQGLRLNPRFLDAVNQLSELADVLYTDGGMGIGFELRGKPVRDVVQTRFTLDGEQHHYFNQRERWQRFRWPGQGDRPGTSLTWSSVHGGERLFADHQGVWGLIRLLEQAQVTPLDDRESRFEVVLKAPDGLGLTWHLRTELGEGPLALLKLRSFALPKDIFLQEGADDIAQR